MQSLIALLPIDKTAKTPVFLQISTALVQQIRCGRIPAGSKLPGTRALAQLLGLHRKTVIAAYDELLAQGWLESRASSGTFVSQKLPEISPSNMSSPDAGLQPREKVGFFLREEPLLAYPIIKGARTLAFNDGFPDVRLAPWDALSRAFRSVLRQGYRKNLLQYADVYGEDSLRQAMAEYLRETRGLAVQTSNVLIARGSTMGIYLSAQALLEPGDAVVVGQLGYGSANLIFQQAGACLLTVPVDQFGLDVDAIAQICRQNPPRMVYVTPHHHYPTTATMPADRRLRLLELAQQYNFCILEDDYDYDFHYDSNPVLPLAGADAGGHVVYVGSLCKAISPALRVGYVAAPTEMIERLGKLRRLIDRQGDYLLEAAVAQLFRDGDIGRHLRKAQKIYQRRRDFFCALLKSELGRVATFTKPSGGMAVWTAFDASISLQKMAERAAEKGLRISNGLNYPEAQNHARLGFASVNEEEMIKGMEILKNVL